jgi:peptide/nickel transport system substrate-binding protein
MTRLRNNDGSPLHPWVPELADQVTRGAIGRRSFLRTVALLGVSVASAKAFLGGDPARGLLLGAREAAAAEPKKGGVLRMAMQTQEITDPANYNWVEASDITRNCIEYLTYVDENNIVHPYLADSFTPSDDLKTWTFKLHPGIKWSNGDDFTSDDVEANFKRWLKPDSKSSNRSAFEPVTQFEKVSPTEFKLHLSRPILAIPEMLYAYTCPIVHRRFDEEGGNWQKNPVGTGPYKLAEFGIGKIARVVRRDGYWGKAPYLDEIRYIDLGSDIATHLTALAAGQVDAIYRITPGELDLAKRLPNVQIVSNPSAMTLALRMQVDQKPFDDIRVRKAILLAADNQKMLDLALRGQGIVGENHHVASNQPEYFKLPPFKRNVAQAKALLEQAGMGGGKLNLAITVGNTQGRYEQDTAQVLSQNLAEAGINLKLDVLPTAQYWPIWDKTPFGVTFWAHRPLAVMTHDLAYRSTAVWNETHFKNADYDKALDEAMSIVDPKERSKSMERVESIIQDQAVMVQPYFVSKMTALSKKVQNFKMHPAEYFRMDEVWLA